MKKQHRISIKAVLFTLVLALGFSLIAPSTKGQVYAASLEALEQRKAEIASNLAKAKSDLESLNTKSSVLSNGLEALVSEQKLAVGDYEKLLKQVELAKNNVEVAVNRYTEAVKDVEAKQKEYESRITSMFRIRNKSTLEVILDSDSMEGFLTNLRLMAYMSSVDQSMLTQLEDARATQEAAKTEAEKVKKDYEDFAVQKEKQIENVKAGIALKESEINNVGDKILSASSNVQHYESEQVTTNSEIEALMAVARQKAEAYAAEQAKKDEAAAAEQQAAISASIANSEQAASVEAASIAESEAAAAREAESRAAAEAAAAEASRSLAEVVATATTGEDGSTDPATTTQAPTTTATPALTTPSTTLAEASSSGGNSGNSGSSGPEQMIYPLASYRGISDDFGYRSDPATGATRMHWGVDFPAPAGTAVRAANSGEVIIASAPLQGSTYGWANDGFGNYISILRNDGLIVMYAHLKNVYVSVGQRVSQGEVIGEVGSTGYSTGPHLHFQVRSPYSSDWGVSPWNYLN